MNVRLKMSSPEKGAKKEKNVKSKLRLRLFSGKSVIINELSAKAGAQMGEG